MTKPLLPRNLPTTTIRAGRAPRSRAAVATPAATTVATAVAAAVAVPLGTALGLALFAPLAQAQSKPEITIYGRASVSLDQLDDGKRSRLNENSNSSRLGFRVKYDLENQLTALAQIEQEIRWDNGSGNFASRDTFVGLQGGFGLVRLGYFDTPLKEVRGQVDFFGDQIGDARNLTRVRDGYSGGDYDFDTRFRNGIAYATPKFGGVSWSLHYSTNTDEGLNVENNSAVSTALTFAEGPWYLAAAFERKQETGSRAIRLGGKYTVGPVAVAALAQMATVKDAEQGPSFDVNVYGLGASYQLTPATTLKGQYYWLSSDGNERDANLMAIGLDFRLASQLRLMFAYARTSNDANVRYGMSRGGHGGQQLASAAGLNTSGLSIGLRFDF